VELYSFRTDYRLYATWINLGNALSGQVQRDPWSQIQDNLLALMDIILGLSFMPRLELKFMTALHCSLKIRQFGLTHSEGTTLLRRNPAAIAKGGLTHTREEIIM
jgi:hypothetical protein